MQYNSTYKHYLEGVARIHCAHCSYHQDENYDGGYYGEYYSYQNKKSMMKYPNWKLVSKNQKQWMKKPIKIIITSRINWNGEEYTNTEINF